MYRKQITEYIHVRDKGILKPAYMMIDHDNAIEICHKFFPDFQQTPLKIKLCKVQIYNKNS